MLAACRWSRRYWRSGQLDKCNHSLPNWDRNKAILLTLLDTGLRASELCNAKIADIDLINKWISVVGKGNNKRSVYLCSRTALVLMEFVSVDTCTGLGFNGDFWINRYVESEVPDAIITWSQDHLYFYCQ